MKQQFWHDPLLPFAESRRAWQSRACYRPHTHAALSIGAVDAGHSLLQVSGRPDQRLLAGDIVVIPAHCVHACNPAPEASWSYQMLYLDTGWIHDLQGAHSPATRPHHFRDPEYYRCFCRLNALLFADVPPVQKEEALIDFAGRILLDEIPATSVRPAWVGMLIEKLDAECAQNPSIAELAACAGISAYHLIRIFKQHTGLSPHAFQLDCRIRLARQRLRHDVALAELALELGFSDQSHFQRAFRQRVSVTPGEYQRQLRP
jgi:AraC-like DNA-binding protein